MPIIFDRETLADDKELLNRFFDQEMPDAKASQRNEKTYIENLMKEDENLSRNEARKIFIKNKNDFFKEVYTAYEEYLEELLKNFKNTKFIGYNNVVGYFVGRNLTNKILKTYGSNIDKIESTEDSLDVFGTIYNKEKVTRFRILTQEGKYLLKNQDQLDQEELEDAWNNRKICKNISIDYY